MYDGPQLVNPNVVDYHVPRAKDMPRGSTRCSPNEAMGSGHGVRRVPARARSNPIGPAVAAAVPSDRALATRLPLTPERVWRLMNDLEGEA